MAHTCPECDQVCHCNGDIDDIILDGTAEQYHCAHELRCQADDDDDDDDDGFGIFDDDDDDNNFYEGFYAEQMRRHKKIKKERHRKVKPYRQPKKVHLSFSTGRLHLYSKKSIAIALQLFGSEDLPF